MSTISRRSLVKGTALLGGTSAVLGGGVAQLFTASPAQAEVTADPAVPVYGPVTVGPVTRGTPSWSRHRSHYVRKASTMSISGNGKTRATAVITVHKYEPVPYEEPADGPALTRIHVEESFSGDIEGDGITEFLQAAQADGSASFVGIERVTGTVAARRGTFLLQDAGVVEGTVVTGNWFVVPGSGTGELTGLRGEGGFRANLGEGAQVHLDHWFE
jgi:hypothetical protein